MIYQFALFLRRNDLELSVPNVVTTSEVLCPSQRDVIRKVLRCKVINKYGA